ncbi:MAG: hypothetical protein IBJ03_18760 [Gemmatimonadaceae bacterium]|nr:hypothetical protein [Gemmatimonadaceae bacterium]
MSHHNPPSNRVSWACLATLLSVLAGACIDTARPGPSPAVVPGSEYYTASLTGAIGLDGTTVLSMRLLAGVSAQPIGGYRVSFTLPVGLDTVPGGTSQAGASGNVQRVVSIQGRTVHVAGIASSGFTDSELFVLGVRGKDANGVAQSLTVHELVDVKGGDQLSRLRPHDFARPK